MPHAACTDCHLDYHQGQFAEAGIIRDCAECHTVQEPFTFTTFTIDDHQQASFPLAGAHAATPCFACHVSEERWDFEFASASLNGFAEVRCVTCHDDIHEGLISAAFYPAQDCRQCHLPEKWSTVSFDHTLTAWPLLGAHEEVACADCHFNVREGSGTLGQFFQNRSTNCESCHQNPHGDQFAVAGTTACASCHDMDDWVPSGFDHDATDFPLTGKHAEVSCGACHTERSTDGLVLYQLDRFACIDCHN